MFYQKRTKLEITEKHKERIMPQIVSKTFGYRNSKYIWLYVQNVDNL